jgi:hypothetical protein
LSLIKQILKYKDINMSELKYSASELEYLLGLSRRRVNELCKDLDVKKKVIPILRPRKSISR